MSMVEMRQPSGFWSEDLVDVEDGDILLCKQDRLA